MPKQEVGPLAQLSQQAMEDSLRWFPDAAPSLLHHVLGLAGETGEVAEIVKKVDRGSLPPLEIDPNNQGRSLLIEELTDVLIYVMNLFAILRADPDQAWALKRKFNEARFGEPKQTDKLYLPGKNGDPHEK